MISFPKCFNLGLELNGKSKYEICSHCMLNYKNCNFYEGSASSNKINKETEVNKAFVWGNIGFL